MSNTKVHYTVRAMPYLKNAGEEIEGVIEIDLEEHLSRIVTGLIKNKHPGFGVKDIRVEEDDADGK